MHAVQFNEELAVHQVAVHITECEKIVWAQPKPNVHLYSHAREYQAMDSNASIMPSSSNEGARDSVAAANIEQLCVIDETIAELMSHASAALKALGDSASIVAVDAPILPDSEPNFRPPSERLVSFQDATDAFLAALHSVDVRIKRQLWALEEADILRFPEDPASDDEVDDDTKVAKERDNKGAAAHKVRASLAPDARGSYGGLDVGWLNSRIMGSAVQKEQETELWKKARLVLEQKAAQGQDESASAPRGGSLEGNLTNEAS